MCMWGRMCSRRDKGHKSHSPWTLRKGAVLENFGTSLRPFYLCLPNCPVSNLIHITPYSESPPGLYKHMVHINHEL